jgi:hypothetical protein
MTDKTTSERRSKPDGEQESAVGSSSAPRPERNAKTNWQSFLKTVKLVLEILLALLGIAAALYGLFTQNRLLTWIALITWAWLLTLLGGGAIIRRKQWSSGWLLTMGILSGLVAAAIILALLFCRRTVSIIVFEDTNQDGEIGIYDRPAGSNVELVLVDNRETPRPGRTDSDGQVVFTRVRRGRCIIGLGGEGEAEIEVGPGFAERVKVLITPTYTPMPTETPSPAELLCEVFEQAVHGKVFRWTDPQRKDGTDAVNHQYDSKCMHSGRHGLLLNISFRDKEEHTGWGVDWTSAPDERFDASGYKILSLYVSLESGGKDGEMSIDVGLKDTNENERKHQIVATEGFSEIPIQLSEYTATAQLNGVDLAKLHNVSFGFSSEHGDGSICIDDIEFR